jgi:hypothetical protein
MTSLVYLLRNPVSRVSSALYSPEDCQGVVIGLEAALEDPASSAACVLDSGMSRTLVRKQCLQYDELLMEVMKYAKIIVL